MRSLDLKSVSNAVCELLTECAFCAGSDLVLKIHDALNKEQSPLGQTVLKQILENQKVAKCEAIPLCQDTGQVVVFLEIGSEVAFTGDIEAAINRGVIRAYTEGYLRKSVVADPLRRKNTGDNTPAIIHTKIFPGHDVKITVVPKGGGAENMSAVKMLTPAEGETGIIQFVLDTVKAAGGKACPPLIVGIGIGGNLEKAPLLAKEALLRDLADHSPLPHISNLEEKLLTKINETGIGPMGYGGRVTALAVKINTYPCHIASLPVAVNLQCHVTRHKSKVL
ncbi:MAG: fumarate hydratase [Bacilli bacterium]|nr:fumarate hydratase [Bacilli bacterium]